MNSNNLEYLTTVKKEYQEQLVSILSKQVYLGIKQLYNDVKKQCMKTRDRNVMAKFQEQMSLVPQWGTDLISRETQRITQKSQCEYLQDLIAAVFLSNTKILSATSKKRQIDVDVPSLSIFVHGVYKEVARSLYSNPELIRDYDLDKWEQQRNYRECKVLIDNAIETTIRKHLPFKNILTNYLEFSINDQQVETKSPEKKTRKSRRRVYESDDEESLESYASWDSESFTATDEEEEEQVNKSTKTKVEEIIVDDEDDSESIVIENKEDVVEADVVEEDIVEEDVVEEDVVEEDIVEEDIVEEDNIDNNSDDNIIEEEINVDDSDDSDEEDEIVIEEDIIKIPEETVIEKENIILEEEDNITDEKTIIEEEIIEKVPVIKEEEVIEEIPVIEEEEIEETPVIMEVPLVEEEVIEEIPVIEEKIIEEESELQNIIDKSEETENIEEVVINSDINEQSSTQDIELYDSANDENIKEEIRKIPISSNARRNLGLVKNLEKESKKPKKPKTPKKPETMNALFFPDLEDDDDF
jgi:hypothetical protein